MKFGPGVKVLTDHFTQGGAHDEVPLILGPCAFDHGGEPQAESQVPYEEVDRGVLHRATKRQVKRILKYMKRGFVMINKPSTAENMTDNLRELRNYGTDEDRARMRALCDEIASLRDRMESRMEVDEAGASPAGNT